MIVAEIFPIIVFERDKECDVTAGCEGCSQQHV